MKKGQPTHLVYEFDTLYDGVVKQAQRYGDKDRYIYKVKKDERHFSFNDMLRHVNYFSSALTKLGVAGQFISVTGDTHPDYVATYIGTVATGGTIVPLDKDWHKEEIAKTAKKADASFVFCDDEVSEKAEAYSCR